ncbi:alpha/beta hydrolase family esterase [Metabacillus iocasae]|uniref:Poly(Hydroxyalkanoate) depolymerase family esterase n=1 Tax=Priestia iocasae TaxID=2291674 RepID=A0ABS2QWJ7_9BACI|nr:PHB depolymerase family esterase [Metabacillus iocasae]MBM7703854.1 poly(hydroxyalkanoate) depolymerase family esterase [Metabacillus iocasae]
MSEALAVIVAMLLLICGKEDETDWDLVLNEESTFQSFAFGGKTFKLYLPKRFDENKSYPLMVMLHGCTQDATDFAMGTNMNQLADDCEFLVLYPQQTQKSNVKKCWNWFSPSHQKRGKGEPRIIVGMVNKVKSMYNIRDDQVYVAGLSAGGAMSVILGATYPDVFSGIGVAAGLEYKAASNVLGAYASMASGGPNPIKQGKLAYKQMGKHARAVPIIVFQGTADRTVIQKNAHQVVSQWIVTNDLADNGEMDDWIRDVTIDVCTEAVPFGRSYTSYTYKIEDNWVVAQKHIIDGMGHAWSGGNEAGTYTDPQGPDASKIMWEFFMSQSTAVH